MASLRSSAIPSKAWQLRPVLLLFISLGSLSANAQNVSPCEKCVCAGDRDGDGTVTIDDAVAVVVNALRGCPQLRWYNDCPPVRTAREVCPPRTEFCTTESVGELCAERQATCCVPGTACTGGGDCEESLICAERATELCPISRRHFKRDIEYLAASDLERLRAQLLVMSLARFRYRSEPISSPPHLGFIIDDVEPSASIDQSGDRVDLYGYISMAVATIQVQEGEIQAMRQELKALREQIEPFR